MALPILDGNQTAVTLATTVSGGAHYPNHIIASGAVTAANIPTKLFDDAFEGGEVVVAQLINADGQVSIANPLPISGTVTANVFGYDQPNDSFAQIRVQEAGEPISQITPVLAVGIANQNGGINESNPLPISGTVTANSGDFAKTPAADTLPPAKSIRIGFGDDENWHGVGLAAGGSPLPVILYSNQQEAFGGSTNGMVPFQVFGTVTVGNSVTIGSCVTHGVTIANSSVTVNGTFWQATQPVSLASTTVTVSSLPSISGTVTANVSSTTVTVSALPSGALTTQFGSVTTANTAQLTAAVTNSSRKFLLVQNIATSTVTIGIGFAPTTTQGIQLAAGAGLTFDAFCPTGGVWWLSGTTGANWSVLEG